MIAFLEPPQGEVIDKILRHCGLWHTPRAPPRSDGRRSPPGDEDSAHDPDGDWQGPRKWTYVDIDTFEGILCPQRG
ncbi:MAG: hypothetical protein ABSG86_18475 [Thermoguttaceae bacterium]